jgi:membrane-associated phospholipid phosphatase
MDQDFFCAEQLFLWTFGEFCRRHDFEKSDWGTETSFFRYLSTRRHGKLYGWVMRDLFETRLQKLTKTFLNSSTFIEKYICRENVSLHGNYFIQSSGSFPSGHASLVIYTCIFLGWYFHARFSGGKHLMALIHSLLFLWAGYGGFTRILDNRHHARDVWTGYGMGIGFAIYTV